MAWTEMPPVQAAVALFIAVLFVIERSSARVPKFAIGPDFHTYYAQHHIDSPDEPHDLYQVYSTENSKELFVEPRIQIIPPSSTENGSKHEVDDVCDYKILPTVRTAPVQTEKSSGVNATNSRSFGGGNDNEEAEHETGGRPEHRSQDEDYNEDSDDDDEEGEELPFTIRPSKENKHEAIIEAKKPLNCEYKAQYEFDIVAISCAGDVSKSARVGVKVDDVNEFEPKFSRSSYEAVLEEGRVVDRILQVEAFDEDCSEEFSRIARYEISDPHGSPFTIDEKGVISNQRPLNYTQAKNHFLSIVAYDRGGKKSVYPAMVNIKVIPVCTPQWEVSPLRVDYVPDASQVKLYQNAKLDFCEASISASGCTKVEKITGHVTLKNDHIGKGCDREDKLPLQVQRKRCASKIQPHSSLIELLPAKVSAEKNFPKMDNNNTLHGSNILRFDGVSTAVILPSQKLNPDMFNRSFTITTWLKRDAPVNRTYDHKFPKEHIFCISDDHERSRHHVALYVRNCRLGLLLRREPHPGDLLTVFRPAEWRWNLDDQLCGGQWHHYAVSVKYPDVKLFIDGKEFDDDAETEIIDDWALHPIKGLQTTTVIGACWQGSQNRMDQYLKGYLDGLSMLVNETEEESVLQCMQKCAERLTVPRTQSSTQAVFSMLDADENEMLVEGYDVAAFQKLISQIGYENDRMYPAPGVRFVDMRTFFTCTKKEGNTSFTITKDLQDVRLTLKVTEASPPTVTLTGPTTLTIDGMENPETDIFDTGVKVLDSVTISVMRASSPALVAQDQRGSLIPDYESMVKKFERDVVLLDSCTLKLRNERRADGVTLNVSDVLVRSLQMEVKHSAVSAVENQWVISGVGIANEIPEFLSVLRDVRLKLNREHVAALSSVVLKVSLSCMEMFSKTPSAEYILEIDLKNFEHLEKTVLHPVEMPIAVHRSVPKSHLVAHNEHVIPKDPVLRQHDLEAIYGPRSIFSVPQFHTSSEVGRMTSTGAAITVVVVVCVSFFIFLVFLAVVKIRSIHRRTLAGPETDLRAVNNRKKRSKMTLKSLKKLRKSIGRKRVRCEDDLDDDEYGDDVEQGHAAKPKPDMKWDDEGMSITVNPLEEMQVGTSDCEYDDQDIEDDDYHQDYDDGDLSEEEKENCHNGRVIQEDDDSAAECDECSKPNRSDIVASQSPSIRRSQSCTEAFAKSKDSRMTRSDLEWDDQI